VWANYKAGLDGKGWALSYLMPDLDNGRKKRNTRGPVIPSPKALVAREGIDDRKYIETLRYFARKKNAKSDLKYLKTLPKRAREVASLNNIGGIDNNEAVVTQSEALQVL